MRTDEDVGIGQLFEELKIKKKKMNKVSGTVSIRIFNHQKRLRVK